MIGTISVTNDLIYGSLHQISDPESAIYETIFTAGGFSNFFAIPDYQKQAVQSFLTNHPPPYPPEIWNSTGNSRAYPDISLNGLVMKSILEDHLTHEFEQSKLRDSCRW